MKALMNRGVTLALALALAGCAEQSERSPSEPKDAPATAGRVRGPLPDAARVDVEAALASYERARVRLAADELDGVGDEAAVMARHLDGAGGRLQRGDAAATWLRDAAQRVLRLKDATSLEEARARFQGVSEVFVTLLAEDPKLRAGLKVYECPMVEGFNRWLQPGDALENPYMGTKMLACGTASEWKSAAAKGPPTEETDAPHTHDDEVAYYTCPMHPSVKQSGKGQCPLCGMDLVPVSRADLASGQIIVDDLRRQKIGVRTTQVTRRSLTSEIRTVGRVTFDETRLHDVSLKLGGWVERLHVDETGQPVRRGQVLFTLYSPDLYAAQVELVAAQRAMDAAGDNISRTLGSSAAKKLALWDLTSEQIEQLKQAKEPRREMPIVSPATGHVVEKNVVAGSRVDAGRTVYRIADLSRVWVETSIFEADLPRVKVGQPAAITLSYLPGRVFEGEVSFVAPVLDEKTRTGTVRIELPNEDLALKPNMYADVSLRSAGGEALQVPTEAVIYTGRRRLVFVDLGEGRLRPQEITVGRHGQGFVEVLSGLEAGDVVVTSGNFLLAAESRLKNATRFWHDDETVAPSPSPERGSHP